MYGALLNALQVPGNPADHFQSAVKELIRQESRRTERAALLIQLIFVRFDPGSGPTFAVGKLTFPRAESTVVDVCLHHCGGVVAMMPESAIDTQATRLWLNSSPTEGAMVRTALDAIARSAAQSPADIGGPVDVLVLDADGAHWPARKSSCSQ